RPANRSPAAVAACRRPPDRVRHRPWTPRAGKSLGPHAVVVHAAVGACSAGLGREPLQHWIELIPRLAGRREDDGLRLETGRIIQAADKETDIVRIRLGLAVERRAADRTEAAYHLPTAVRLLGKFRGAARHLHCRARKDDNRRMSGPGCAL